MREIHAVHITDRSALHEAKIPFLVCNRTLSTAPVCPSRVWREEKVRNGDRRRSEGDVIMYKRCFLYGRRIHRVGDVPQANGHVVCSALDMTKVSLVSSALHNQSTGTDWPPYREPLAVQLHAVDPSVMPVQDPLLGRLALPTLHGQIPHYMNVNTGVVSRVHWC